MKFIQLLNEYPTNSKDILKSGSPHKRARGSAYVSGDKNKEQMEIATGRVSLADPTGGLKFSGKEKNEDSLIPAHVEKEASRMQRVNSLENAAIKELLSDSCSDLEPEK